MDSSEKLAAQRIEVQFKLFTPWGKSHGYTTTTLFDHDPLYPYAKLMLATPGINKVIAGSYNLGMFATLATVHQHTSEISLESAQTLNDSLRKILSECKWIGDQNYAAELFLGEDRESPFIHADRKTSTIPT